MKTTIADAVPASTAVQPPERNTTTASKPVISESMVRPVIVEREYHAAGKPVIQEEVLPLNDPIFREGGVSVYEPLNKDTFTTNVVIADKPVVKISDYLQEVCRVIQSQYPGLEFSILAKCTWNNSGIVVSDEIAVPKQKVSSGRIEYEPLMSYKTKGYEVVIHSHHDMPLGVFSPTDHDYINSFFPVSILFCRGRFSSAQVLYQIPKGYARYDVPIEMFTSRPHIVIKNLDKKITKESWMDSFRRGLSVQP